MSITRTHKTSPNGSGVTEHLWTVGSDTGSVSLSALRTTETIPDLGGYAVPATGGGSWVFNVISTHQPVARPVFGCGRHEGCEADSIVSQVARPAWSRIVAAEMADDAVYAELEAIHALEFPGVTA